MTREELIEQLQRSDAPTVVLEQRMGNGQGGGNVYHSVDIQISTQVAQCGTKKIVLTPKRLKLVGSY